MDSSLDSSIISSSNGSGNFSVRRDVRSSTTHCITYAKDRRFLGYFVESPIIIILPIGQNYRFVVYLCQ